MKSAQILYAHWLLEDRAYAAWVVESIGEEEVDFPPDGDADNDGATNWEEYIVGTNPLNSNEYLKACIQWEDEQMIVKPSVLNLGRVYSVKGKKALADEEWEDLTGVKDWDAEGWRFFRVGVKMAE